MPRCATWCGWPWAAAAEDRSAGANDVKRSTSRSGARWWIDDTRRRRCRASRSRPRTSVARQGVRPRLLPLCTGWSSSTDPGTFTVSLSAVQPRSTVSAGLLRYSGEVRLETDELETGYEVNIPLSGHLRTWTGHADVCAVPASRRSTDRRMDPAARLGGWRRPLRAEDRALPRAGGRAGVSHGTVCPVDRATGPEPPDLRDGAGRQWWSLTRALVDLAKDPDGPLGHPMVARPRPQRDRRVPARGRPPYRDLLACRPVAWSATIREAVELLEAGAGASVVRHGPGPPGRGHHARPAGRPAPPGHRADGSPRQVRRAAPDLRGRDPARGSVADAGRWDSPTAGSPRPTASVS